MSVRTYSPMARRRRPRASAALAALIVVALLLALCYTLESRVAGTPLSVAVIVTEPGSNSFGVTLRLTANYGSIDAHVAVVPGESSTPISEVFVFYDSAFFLRFGNAVDVVGLEERLSDFLSEISPATPVAFVDSAQLPAVLEANPHAAFIDFCYATLPSTVLSPDVTLLKSWIEGGGTLIWAGGPLAFFEGNPAPNGTFVYDNLGWEGQLDLAGYPLEDPVGDPASRSAGPLLASNESAVGAALGVSFDGTPDGANVSELATHGGVDLGFDSASVNGASPRTSLAFASIGSGRLFFFGGAVWGDAEGTIPSAAGYIASDIELLVVSAYSPLPGPATYATLTVGYLSPTTVTLSLNGSYSHFVVVVTCTSGAVSLFVWSKQVV